MKSEHKTVLLKETVEGLELPEKPVVLDATFGGGGHSLLVFERYPGAKVIAFDQDKGAWKRSEDKFMGRSYDISFLNANFRDIGKVMEKVGVEKLDGAIFDLGLSSDQLAPQTGGLGRGFSFLHNEPLIMTMKEDPGPEDLTAYDAVNGWGEESLQAVIRGYGEERYWRKIAKAIVDAREKEPIKTTFELAEIIKRAVPGEYRRGRIHFATRTFQALRIAVNDELGSLEKGIRQAFEALRTGGRMSVISFHSLEDRIVKNFYKEKVREGKGVLINKKPIVPGEEELKNNPRSRSAKLRIISRR